MLRDIWNLEAARIVSFLFPIFLGTSKGTWHFTFICFVLFVSFAATFPLNCVQTSAISFVAHVRA